MLVDVLLAALLGAALLVAAALKVADRTSTAVGAAAFGLHGRAARAAWLPLALAEALLAAGLLAGATAAAWATAAVLATFAAAQAIAIAAGRGGAPCGCFGDRSRISWGSTARTAALAGAALVLALSGGAATAPVAARAVAAAAALALAALLVAQARRGAPAGALEVAGEGPPLGARIDLGEPGVRLALFSSPGCRLCRALAPRAERRLGAVVFDERDDRDAWDAAAVPGAPFAIALAPDGTVLAKGTVNSQRQIESILAAARQRGGDAVDEPTSRRGFLATAGASVAALAAARGAAPGDADAYHFCGHIYTTDSCPHPTGLPRIDHRGLPLRGRDGKPVDDLGRLIDGRGTPIGDDGAPLRDPDGRPLPPATRTRVCNAAGRRYRIRVRTDGAWYRCCNGHVRKLVDCCTTSRRRINSDAGLTGYCYGGRRVFCVMYVQTKIPC